MTTGWRYRVASAGGTVGLVVLAVALANHPVVQSLLALVPVLGDLPLAPADGMEFAFEATTAVLVVLVALGPLLKPRPRRILDTASVAAERTLLATVSLAAVGYFDYTYRLPRVTLLFTTAFLLLTVPVWFVAIRRRPRDEGGRTILVGDDPAAMNDILDAVAGPVLGFVSPPGTTRELALAADPDTETALGLTDGGSRMGELPSLGGLSRLDEVLVEYDVDTVVLAFAEPDRAEFFGALDTCYDHGVAAKVHRRHADSVLTSGFGQDELVDVELEPWDPQDHFLKRGFDIAFAGVGLLVLSPVMLGIAAAIKLEDGGSVLYRQERTASFGDTFDVYKFRSMRETEMDDTAPVADEGNDRITRVGRFIRRTHLDELPQLWSILIGDMSVVGPRAAWTGEETHLEAEAEDWRKRWFVKPGLTGLAQINGATSLDPEAKLRYDVEYIRRQSFWFDLKIVMRQVWMVVVDVVRTVTGRPLEDG
ncbi:sugar transferase [Haloglomus salinum]|jgi:lipopolysaccharide/colanic/teichoic acid biosynthesis glycosyltransferase|uniref:sugar transferase n=1 Tax=Haloglomus salinum TaxID=2962673 RepID=UPI0020C9BE1E|nr:sugar transferase [Haloglomus salinum]